MFRVFALLLLTAAPLFAQTEQKEMKLVLPSGPGAITISLTGDWHIESIRLYPDGPRPVFFLSDKKTGLEASYILFFNDTKAPTAESCRKAVMEPMRSGLQREQHLKLENVEDSTVQTSAGQTLLTTTHFLPTMEGMPIQQQNEFGFFGDEKNCAEVHLSKVKYTKVDQPLFDRTLQAFAYDSTYKPQSMDYALVANLFYTGMHDYKSAAVYFQRALDTAEVPESGPRRWFWFRLMTDQTAMSYGMSGDLKRSRDINLAAIARDPDYPLYYYNLACADAESGDASAARTHLQQAFDRRANTLPGEHMPDPSQDDSILKLKKNKDFWAFVQSLPKN